MEVSMLFTISYLPRQVIGRLLLVVWEGNTAVKEIKSRIYQNHSHLLDTRRDDRCADPCWL